MGYRTKLSGIPKEMLVLVQRLCHQIRRKPNTGSHPDAKGTIHQDKLYQTTPDPHSTQQLLLRQTTAEDSQKSTIIIIDNCQHQNRRKNKRTPTRPQK